MKAGVPFVLCLFVLAQLATRSPAGNRSEITCGQTIIENTTLDSDLTCPPGTMFAIIIGASNITLDLGGHTVLGQSPGIGVYADGVGEITIRIAGNASLFATRCSSTCRSSTGKPLRSMRATLSSAISR